jgi:hypothetical protein
MDISLAMRSVNGRSSQWPCNGAWRLIVGGRVMVITAAFIFFDLCLFLVDFDNDKA